VPKSNPLGLLRVPLLHGDRIIGRFDLAVDRNAGVLNVVGEDGSRVGGPPPAGAPSMRALSELRRSSASASGVRARTVRGGGGTLLTRPMSW